MQVFWKHFWLHFMVLSGQNSIKKTPYNQLRLHWHSLDEVELILSVNILINENKVSPLQKKIPFWSGNTFSDTLLSLCCFCSCRVVSPQIPAFPQTVAEPTHPESRPQAAGQPPLQHQRCGYHLHNTITAVNHGTAMHGGMFLSLYLLCVLPESSRARLSPGPPSSVCHSS